MSNIPLHPPVEWFDLPEEPLGTNYIGDDGRVMFALASFDSCHIGRSDVCWRPPQQDDFVYAHQGVTKFDGGLIKATAPLPLGGGHAPVRSALQHAQAFYADTNHQVARGCFVADEENRMIWFCGALWPSATDEDIEKLRGSRLSGDWRKVKGQWRLVGACAVNIPGLPVDEVIAASAEYEVHEDVAFEKFNIDGEEFGCGCKKGGKGGKKRRTVQAAGEIQVFAEDDGFVPFSAILVKEGVATGDGRYIEEGATTHRELPLPLLAVEKNEGGHMGSKVIGRIDTITRDGSIIFGSGVIDTTDEFAQGIIRQLETEQLRGISIDGTEIDFDYDEEEDLIKFSAIKIAGATVVPIPAIEGAEIKLDNDDAGVDLAAEIEEVEPADDEELEGLAEAFAHARQIELESNLDL